MKRYEVRFRPEAIDDLDSLYFYVAEATSFETADRYLTRIEKLCSSLGSFPQRGTAVKGKLPGCRSMGFERRATIVFRIGVDAVEILRILHHGRDIAPIVDELTDD